MPIRLYFMKYSKSIKELTDRLAELENKNSELQRLVDQLVENQL